MFGARPLLESACSVVAAGSTSSPLELLQAVEISNTLDATVYSVPNIASLPSAACNKGRMVFVQDKDSYRYSDGVSWTNDFSTVQTVAPTIWAWGANFNGRLGDGTTSSRSSPVSVIGGFTDWCQVSSDGAAHVAAIRQNGTLWAWGSNLLGKLGDGTVNDRCSPVSVVGGFTDWCYVSAGPIGTAAIRTNGTLWTWGAGIVIGNGSSTLCSRSSPVSVAGGFSDWQRVSATGSNHALGLRGNGTLWGWGSNNGGRLGDGTTNDRCSPVSVIGGFTDWCEMAAGAAHSAAIRTNGTLWTWGQNNDGQLGDNSTISKSSPVSVVGGFTDWCQVAAYRATVAIRTNGTLWAWGCNNGRLGDNTIVNKSSPVSVVGGFTDWCFASTSNSHTAAVRTNGTLWAWGTNDSGQLGDNTTVNKSSPVSIVGGLDSWVEVGVGSSHTTAIRYSKGFPAL